MSWENEYKSKLTTAEKAVELIKSGNRVVIGHACGVEIVHMVAMGKAGYAQPGMESHFRHNALFVGGTTRKAVAEGRGDYTPCFFYRIPSLFTNGSLPVDVALVQATPPDENGNMSLGISIDYTLPAARAAKSVIVQVNHELPRTGGDSCINASDANIAAIVEHDAPIIELAPPKIGDVERAIGANCASLIHDGDTLQLGIGAIPDAVLLFLTEKKDLGIHSEMFSDGVVELVEKGVITNTKKKTHVGKFVANFLMGTKRLYDFVNNNPDVEMYPVDYVNNPVVVMKEDNIVSIGYTQISGVGGQVDFVRGAAMAKNGRSILAFPSTAAKGTVSKIVPLLDEGAAVTTSRNDVDYVITEYGIAKLSGKTLKQRAHALIEIAHPNFRDELKKVYEERFHCSYE